MHQLPHPWRAKELGIKLLMLTATTFLGAAPSLHAQPIPPMAGWGYQTIRVANDCYAYSMRPQDMNGMMLEWRGPCIDRSAHGDGVLVTRMAGVPMSIARAHYTDGQMDKLSDIYTYASGALTFKATPTDWPISEDLPPLPQWALELAATAKHWAEWKQNDYNQRRGRGFTAPRAAPRPAEAKAAAEAEEVEQIF